MEKFKKIANIVLIVLAYGFLGYKIATYDNYAGLLERFSAAEWWQLLCLMVCVALFPVNRLCEAWKWQFLVRGIEPMNIREAQRQVYYGTLAGFVTPYKIGEYPGRALLFRNTEQHWLSATCMGMIGGYAMTTIIIVAGLPSVIYWLAPDSSLLWSIVSALICALAAIFALPVLMRVLQQRNWESEQSRLLIQSLAALTPLDISKLLGISLLRYSVFIVQLLLCLLFCGVQLNIQSTIATLPLYYLLITVTPNVPAAEIAVRGAWAAVIFERFGSDVTAAAIIATLLLWFINTIFPLVVGTAVKRRQSVTSA